MGQLSQERNMHKPSGFRDYLVASLLAGVLLVFLSFYLIVRRGYFFDAPPTADPLFIPNKAIACTGMILLAFTFLLGPLSRYFNRWDHLLAYRKEIGIVGAFLAIFHGLISYFFLPLKFPQAKFDFTNPYTAAGVFGVFLLIFLFVISLQKVIALIEGHRWWLWQRWGMRLVIVATLVHVFMMKWAGWVKWLKQGGGQATAELANPSMPGLGILASLFIVWVVAIRLYESIFLFKDFGFIPKEITVDETLRLRGRRFFQWSLVVLIGLYVFVATRWMN